MKITIMTLFPEMCNAVLDESIIGRARKSGIIEIDREKYYQMVKQRKEKAEERFRKNGHRRY